MVPFTPLLSFAPPSFLGHGHHFNHCGLQILFHPHPFPHPFFVTKLFRRVWLSIEVPPSPPMICNALYFGTSYPPPLPPSFPNAFPCLCCLVYIWIPSFCLSCLSSCSLESKPLHTFPIYKLLLQFGLLQPCYYMSLLLHFNSCSSLNLPLTI